jgi:hypothetical protein
MSSIFAGGGGAPSLLPDFLFAAFGAATEIIKNIPATAAIVRFFNCTINLPFSRSEAVFAQSSLQVPNRAVDN